jgi:hypothetical protein
MTLEALGDAKELLLGILTFLVSISKFFNLKKILKDNFQFHCNKYEFSKNLSISCKSQLQC